MTRMRLQMPMREEHMDALVERRPVEELGVVWMVERIDDIRPGLPPTGTTTLVEHRPEDYVLEARA